MFRCRSKRILLLSVVVVAAVILKTAVAQNRDDDAVGTEPIVTSADETPTTTSATAATTTTTDAPHDAASSRDADGGDEEESGFDRRQDRQPVPDHLKNKCLLRGSCDTKANLVGDVTLPCVEVHDPHPVHDDEARDILKRTCPSLFLESEDPLLCCSPEQVYELETSFQIPDQLGLSRCPSCQYNFRLSFCELTCSPRQSEFIHVVNASVTPDKRVRADAIQLHMTDSYPQQLLDSCSGVQGLAAGQKLLDLLCGSWGSSQCTGVRWLQFMGKSIDTDGQSPYQIDFVFHSDSDRSTMPDGTQIVPIPSTPAVGCWERAPRSAFSCSCNDCEATCAMKELPAEARILPADSEEIDIFGMSGTELLSVLLFLFFLSLILTYFILKAYHKKRTQNRKCCLLQVVVPLVSLFPAVRLFVCLSFILVKHHLSLSFDLLITTVITSSPFRPAGRHCY